MATATPTIILSILDQMVRSRVLIGNLVSYNGNVNVQPLISGGSGGSGDINLQVLVGQANATATLAPYQITNNQRPIGQQFSKLASWISSASNTGTSTLDAYLKSFNVVTPYSYLVSPVTALQYYISPGATPVPPLLTPLVASTSGYLSPVNVFAPVVTFGKAAVTGTNTVTYTNNLSLPTSNNSIQIITVTVGAGGTWTYSYGNQATAGLSPTISATALATAINALSTTAAGAFIVTNPSTGVYTIQATDAFSQANPNIATGVVSGALLTGVGATVTIQNAINAQWSLNITATGGTFTIPVGTTKEGIYTTPNINWNDTASTIQTALTGLLSIGTSNMSVSGSAGAFTITASGILASQPLFSDFLGINTGSLTGGSATLTQTAIGGLQGYTPPLVTNAVITTTVNGTCALTVTANALDSTGVFHAARTFTASLSSATAGTSVALAPSIAGDRIIRITANSEAGTATAGAWNYVSALDRVI